jgi:hypothetical protein
VATVKSDFPTVMEFHRKLTPLQRISRLVLILAENTQGRLVIPYYYLPLGVEIEQAPSRQAALR